VSGEDQQHERDGGDILAETVQPRDQQRRRERDHVVDIDDEEPVKIMDRIHDQMRKRGRRRRKGGDVDAALAADDLLILGDDAHGDQAFEPGGQSDTRLGLAPNEVA
jgi:hypothetical protein